MIRRTVSSSYTSWYAKSEGADDESDPVDDGERGVPPGLERQTDGLRAGDPESFGVKQLLGLAPA